MPVNRILVILFITFLIHGCATSENSTRDTQPSAVTSGSEYVVRSYISKSGNQVYLLICKNKTTMCNYQWATLCTKGIAIDVDPEGNEIQGPGYSRNSQNIPMRMFRCK